MKHRKHSAMIRPEWEQYESPPPVHGLVLAGGKSSRMGRDKGAMDFHGKPQREFAADQLKPLCEQTFLSCRSEQVESVSSDYPTLADTFLDLGPFGALLSAFRHNPNTAWLVIACDLPLLDQPTLEQLVASREPARVATAFASDPDGLPEPLIAIWEPRSYPILLSYLGQGRCCPRKVLINEDVTLLVPVNPAALSNANTPEDVTRLGL